MAAGWVDTDRGAFSRYKSVWLLSTTQQLITLGLGAGKQRSPIQPDTRTHTHTHTLSHTYAHFHTYIHVWTHIQAKVCEHIVCTLVHKHTAQTHTDIWEQVLTPENIGSQYLIRVLNSHIYYTVNTHMHQLVCEPDCPTIS